MQSHEEELKAAAIRMSDFLIGHGIRLKHNLALESISRALGEKDWRTMRSVLSREVPQKEPGSEGFLIHAVYVDNDQRYSDIFGGENALEAQVNALIDRYADYGLEIEITAAIDVATGQAADQEHYTSQVARLGLHKALQLVVPAALTSMNTGPHSDVVPSNLSSELLHQKAMLGWLQKVVNLADQYKKKDIIPFADDMYGNNGTIPDDAEVSFTAYGEEVAFSASAAVLFAAEKARSMPGFNEASLEFRIAVYELMGYACTFPKGLSDVLSNFLE